MGDSSSPMGLLLRIPQLVKGAFNGLRKPPVKKAALAAAVQSVNQGALPLLFCFGCRAIVPERPCTECDRETEVFVVTTQTDRRLVVSRLAAEGDRT